MKLEKSLIERFESKFFVAPDGCWLWLNAPNNSGYGGLSFAGKRYVAHRLSYEIYRETIPVGLVIDHLCKQKLCVNPNHLEVVTNKENQLRKDLTQRCEHGNGKTRCPDGCENYYRKERYYSNIEKVRERGKLRQRRYRARMLSEIMGGEVRELRAETILAEG